MSRPDVGTQTSTNNTEGPMRINFLIAVLALCSIASLQMPAATAAPTPPPAQDLDNPLEPLKTQKPRTEGEDDRIAIG